MNLRATVEFLTAGSTRLLLRANPQIQSIYRLSFLAAAEQARILDGLRGSGLTVQQVCTAMGEGTDRAVAQAWLDFGESVGQVRLTNGVYHLRGNLAKALSDETTGTALAALAEAALYHHQAVVSAPGIAVGETRLSLGDQDGRIIARSTRILEPLVRAVVREVVTPGRSQQLLEVGAGSGTYARYAAELNPRMTGLCIDMQEDVVVQLRRNVEDWGLTCRLAVRCSDLRTLQEQPRFDLVTLHNNIYYAAPHEQAQLVERCRDLLAPGGRLVMTSTVQSSSPVSAALNLWFLCSDFGSALPTEQLMTSLCQDAGFASVRVRHPLPGFPFAAVVADTRP